MVKNTFSLDESTDHFTRKRRDDSLHDSFPRKTVFVREFKSLRAIRIVTNAKCFVIMGPYLGNFSEAEDHKIPEMYSSFRLCHLFHEAYTKYKCYIEAVIQHIIFLAQLNVLIINYY